MKKILAALPLVALLAMPLAAHAHERQTFEINGIKYQFVVGSVGEPMYVDDKSGVELRVERVSILDGHEEHHHDVGPGAVTGLEDTLKVELQADGKNKELELSAAYNEEGLYRATFYPTEVTKLTYRFFGTIESIPIDVSFTCAEAGHVMESEADTSRVDVNPGVVRVSKAGSFGCPREIADAGFPGKLSTNNALQDRAGDAYIIAFISGAIALLSIGLHFRRRNA